MTSKQEWLAKYPKQEDRLERFSTLSDMDIEPLKPKISTQSHSVNLPSIRYARLIRACTAANWDDAPIAVWYARRHQRALNPPAEGQTGCPPLSICLCSWLRRRQRISLGEVDAKVCRFRPLTTERLLPIFHLIKLPHQSSIAPLHHFDGCYGKSATSR